MLHRIMRSPVSLANGSVTVTFTWSGDRWRHHVTTAGGSRWESVEGSVQENGDDRWPASPVLVELSRVDTARGPTILGVGLAGRSHFSASIGPASAVGSAADGGDGLLFEMACRCHERPLWLGSTYRGPAGLETIRPPAAPPPPATVQWAYTFSAVGLEACDRSGNRSDS
jgi:hypothetical protein